MGIRDWMRRRLYRYDGQEQLPAHATMMQRLVREPDLPAGVATTELPAALVERLRRREAVATAILELDLTRAAERVAAIPRLQALLRDYPHPLLYEALIHAYADAGRWDEARGVAYASRDRWQECERSPFPEVRMETDRLRVWSAEEVDALRRERGGN